MIRRAVLLAAGSASRMGSVTAGLPKCLLSIGGQSIVSRALGALTLHGISRVTIVDGFAGDSLREALCAEFPPGLLDFVRNERYAETNNARSLQLALARAGATAESFLLLDADVVFDAGAIGKLLADPHPDLLALRSRGGWGEEDMKVALNPDGSIARIGKDIPLREAAGESVGLEAFSAGFAARLLEVLTRRLESHGQNEWYEAAFQQLLDAGERIHAVDLEEQRSIEIDTPEDLEKARALFALTPADSAGCHDCARE